ncbi:toll-like receptor 5 [Acanthochromis polyacanthus]|uniref:toll-like receptor 5 n=1 Tax=Acanthochromis polyacanthus TaxID=80966 RepID=UPI002233F530|nr:toll-like receptor 5 [Acanthochromis polyacanthus]
MWLLVLQLLGAGFYLQVATCYRSCILNGQKALCSGQWFYRVPALPSDITHLFLDQNYIRELSSASLRDFAELQHLDLGNQKVKLIIRNDAFLQQRNLTYLVLGSNTGLQLDPRAFAGLNNLQSLFLDYCGLTDAILADSFLQPLQSLEMLDLFGNHIVRLQPGLFFSNLTRFTRLNLKLNQIEKLCEGDLVGFKGKYFTYLNLTSNKLFKTPSEDWLRCGNPFKGIAFNILDLSDNGMNKQQITQFFKAIRGTPIAHLKYSGHIGRGFSHNNIPDPDKSTFEGLNSSTIHTLDLSKNFIFSLQNAVFSPLKNATIIDISQNKINQINPNAFDGLQDHLRMLNLSFNLLGKIYSHTFINLTELRVLDLSYNHIGVLGYDAFSKLPRLRGLFLTGNSLRDLGFPATLPNVEYLTLGDNKLSSVYNIAKLGGSSTYVDVTDNRLTDLEDVYIILTHFKGLKTLLFGGNFIKWCTLSKNITMLHSNSLEVLDLHDSSLQIIWAQGMCLHLFDHLENLLGLNISFNSLVALPPGVFSGLSSIIDMDLSYNALTYLQTDVFPVSLKQLDLSNNFLVSPDPMTFRSLTFLRLSENRFHCDCNLYGFLTWLNVTNVTFISPTEDFRCEFPADVHNSPLHNYSRIVEPCEQDDENAVKDLKFALFIFSVLLITSVLLSGIAYARLRGHIFIIYKKIVGKVIEGPKPTPPENEMQYDAFLCFTNSDYSWVEEALLKKLDNQFSEENIFRCCFEARDFLPGEDHLSNIRDAIWDSRKTVCIVSRQFIKGTVGLISFSSNGWRWMRFYFFQKKRFLHCRKNAT